MCEEIERNTEKERESCMNTGGGGGGGEKIEPKD